MRVIVMDREMHEPLTVVDIPASLMRDVESGLRPYITLPVPMNFSAWRCGADLIPNAPETIELRRVNLKMEKIVKGGNSAPYEILFWTAVPDDEEFALLLRAAFLPGQTTELRRRESEARFQGILDALGR